MRTGSRRGVNDEEKGNGSRLMGVLTGEEETRLIKDGVVGATSGCREGPRQQSPTVFYFIN